MILSQLLIGILVTISFASLALWFKRVTEIVEPITEYAYYDQDNNEILVTMFKGFFDKYTNHVYLGEL